MPFSVFNHPFLFAAAAVVAIGVIIYELIEDNKNRQSHSSRRPPPSNPPRPPPSNPPRPPPSNPPRSPPDNPPRPPPNNPPRSPPNNPPQSPQEDSQKFSTGNNLRRRNINKSSSRDSTPEILVGKDYKDSETAVSVKSKASTENLSKTSSIASSQNNPDKEFDEYNYCKNMLGKLTNDAKKVNEEIKGEKVGHNICEEESDSAESNLLPKSEEKVINQVTSNENTGKSQKTSKKRKRKIKSSTEKVAKSHTDKKYDESSDHYESESSSDRQSDNSSIFPPVKVTKESSVHQKSHASKDASDQNSESQASNLYYPKLEFHPSSSSRSELEDSSLSSDEDNYKKDMLQAFKKDLQNCEVISNTSDPATGLSNNIEKVVPPESEFCKGCEEKRVNTRAYPCNHAYLCVGCAVRIFRLYKKCTICLRDVEEFVQFSV